METDIKKKTSSLIDEIKALDALIKKSDLNIKRLLNKKNPQEAPKLYDLYSRNQIFKERYIYSLTVLELITNYIERDN